MTKEAATARTMRLIEERGSICEVCWNPFHPNNIQGHHVFVGCDNRKGKSAFTKWVDRDENIQLVCVQCHLNPG